MDEKTAILTRILAQTDAVWTPCREWSNSRLPTNLFFGRRDYPTVGVPWSSGGADEASRKAIQRFLEELVADGLVTVARPNRSRVLFAKLSDEADIQTRVLCGLPGIAAAHASMIELERLGGWTGRWVATEALMHTDATRPADWSRGEEAWVIELMMLPAIVRQLVEAQSIANGHVYFRVTPAGWQWLDAHPDEPADPDIRISREARAVYDNELRSARHHLQTAQPRVPGELGMMPLNTSMPDAVHDKSQLVEWEAR